MCTCVLQKIRSTDVAPRPLIGGALSNPARKYPEYFNNSFLRTFPYFLPCFIAGMLAFGGVFLAYFFLDEVSYHIHIFAQMTYCPTQTLPSKRRQTPGKDLSLSKSYGATDCEGEVLAASSPPSIMELLSIPIIRALSTSGCALCFIATAFDVVFVLFCYSPIETGGLAFSVRDHLCLPFPIMLTHAVSLRHHRLDIHWLLQEPFPPQYSCSSCQRFSAHSTSPKCTTSACSCGR